MPTLTFRPLWARTYLTYDNSITDVEGPGYPENGAAYGDNLCTYSGIWSNPNGGRKSMVGFDINDMRAKLAGKNVTACRLRAYVYGKDNPPPRAYFPIGFHNYMSPPSYWDNNRAYGGAYGNYNAPYDSWFTWGLSLNYALAFQNGSIGGITVGPAPDQERYWDANMTVLYGGFEMSIEIDYEIPVTPSPNAPTMRTPVSGSVISTWTEPWNIEFTHSDPKNSAFNGAYVRILGNGNKYWYWNGTAWRADVTSLPASAFTTVGANRRITIPASAWPTAPATKPVEYVSVATINAQNLSGPYANDVPIYPSRAPTVSVQQPSGQAYRNARPIIRWTYSDYDGQPQYGWIAQIVAPEVYNKAGYDPSQYTGQLWSYSGDVETQRSVQADVTLENHKTYRAYVRVLSSPNPSNLLQYSSWQYSEFTVSTEPPPPKITTPRTGSTTDLGSGFTISWENQFSSEGGSQQQAAFAIRRTRPGNVDEWWNGTAWVTTEYFAAGSNTSYSFRPNEVPNGVQYTFSVSIRDGYGLISGYGTGVSVFGSTAPQITLLSPPSFITTVRPTVTWTMYDAENDPQQTYHIRLIAKSVYSAGTINPATATAIWSSGEVAGQYTRNVQCPVELLNGSTYRAYLRIQAGGVYSEWAYAEFTISLIPPAMPIVTTEIDETYGAFRITAQGRDSLLAADISRSTGGWDVISDCTIEMSLANAVAKSAYMAKVKATKTNATMRVRSRDSFPIVSGINYTAAATLLANYDTAPLASRVGFEFFDDSGTSTGITWSTDISDGVAQRASVDVLAPNNARQAKMVIEYKNTVDGDASHFFYDPIVRPGGGNEWSPGGLLGLSTVSFIEMNDYRIVRQGINVPVPTDSQRVTILDAEVPMGRPQKYEVTTRAVYPNAVLVADPVSKDAGYWTSGWVWMSDPTDLTSARCFGPEGFDTETRPARTGKFRPIGRADAVFTRGVRGLREGKFTVVTHSRKERESFHELAETADIILLRIPPDRGEVEGETLYVRLEGDLPTSRMMPHRTPHRKIEQEWTEQPRPLTGLSYGEEI